jgi:hypothetical protein
MGVYLSRTENVAIGNGAVVLYTFTHGLGVAPAGEDGEVFIRHRTATIAATVVSSSTQIVVLAIPPSPAGGITVDLLVMAFHSIIK